MWLGFKVQDVGWQTDRHRERETDGHTRTHARTHARTHIQTHLKISMPIFPFFVFTHILGVQGLEQRHAPHGQSCINNGMHHMVSLASSVGPKVSVPCSYRPQRQFCM